VTDRDDEAAKFARGGYLPDAHESAERTKPDGAIKLEDGTFFLPPERMREGTVTRNEYRAGQLPNGRRRTRRSKSDWWICQNLLCARNERNTGRRLSRDGRCRACEDYFKLYHHERPLRLINESKRRSRLRVRQLTAEQAKAWLEAVGNTPMALDQDRCVRCWRPVDPLDPADKLDGAGRCKRHTKSRIKTGREHDLTLEDLRNWSAEGLAADDLAYEVGDKYDATSQSWKFSPYDCETDEWLRDDADDEVVYRGDARHKNDGLIEQKVQISWALEDARAALAEHPGERFRSEAVARLEGELARHQTYMATLAPTTPTEPTDDPLSDELDAEDWKSFN
jgi:hypothetical protein